MLLETLVNLKPIHSLNLRTENDNEYYTSFRRYVYVFADQTPTLSDSFPLSSKEIITVYSCRMIK